MSTRRGVEEMICMRAFTQRGRERFEHGWREMETGV
jgi:hypothetical protein